MNSLRSRISSLPWFFGALLLFWLAGIFLVVALDKGEGYLMITGFHHSFWDVFFKWFTHLGDGLFSVAIVLLLFIRKLFRPGVVLLLAFLLSGLVAQLIKASVVAERPHKYFENIGQVIHEVEGVTLQVNNASLPSGHTASAFALVTSLLLLFPRLQRWQIGLLLVAALVGYSRIYLANHFPIDVLVGSILGVAGALAGYWIVWIWAQRTKGRLP